MTTVRLVIDGAEMQRVLRSPDGPVARHLIKVSDLIIEDARRRIRDNPHRRGPANLSGRLERSVVKRPYQVPGGIGMLIIAGVGLKPSYAYWVHEGNGPQGARIYPRNKRALAWVTTGERPSSAAGWQSAREAGTARIVRSVRTSAPNPFLRDAAEAIIH